jgi:parvulin-like peptidyl-prolyl isomerase
MSHLPPRRLLSCVIIMSLAVAAGCARPRRGDNLEPQFSAGPRAQKPMAADPLSGADQPGALYDNVRLDLAPANQRGGDGGARNGNAAGPPAPTAVEGLSKTVQENVTAPGLTAEAAEPTGSSSGGGGGGGGGAPTTTAATAPATQPGASVGEFFTIGGVVAEVNSTPIYANKVLNLVEPVLAARAKELDAQKFKLVADAELKAQRNALIRHELEYAAAERNLDQRDKDLADMLTLQWRQRQITEAGGSEELARRNAPKIARSTPGLNPNAGFEELVREMYRVHMSQIFYQKRIMPRVQVSAAEMRDYYERNKAQLFADRGNAQFRLIKVDVKKSGGREEALRKISELRNRIVKGGESFEIWAREVNDNPLLLKTGGSVKIDQGAFAVKAVDDAVWSTPEGQVTEIIDGGDAFYIAQVLERKPGRVQPFEDETVQARIKDDLFSRDFREMRRKVQEQLEQDAVIRADPAMMNPALEMAMQNYARWRGDAVKR